MFASARRKKNLIKKLKHGEDWVEGTSALKPIILEYFSRLFTSEVNAVDGIHAAVMEKVQRKVTAEGLIGSKKGYSVFGGGR
jgi:hypothetical protein